MQKIHNVSQHELIILWRVCTLFHRSGNEVFRRGGHCRRNTHGNFLNPQALLNIDSISLNISAGSYPRSLDSSFQEGRFLPSWTDLFFSTIRLYIYIYIDGNIYSRIRQSATINGCRCCLPMLTLQRRFTANDHRTRGYSCVFRKH